MKIKKDKGRNKQEEKNMEDICYGKNAVLALLEEHPERCLSAYISINVHGGIYQKIFALCKERGIPCRKVPKEHLDRQTNFSNHQGVMVKTAPLDVNGMEAFYEIVEKEKEGPLLFVVLDHVEDVQNFSSIIRSAEVLGASAIIFPKRRSALPTGTVLKVSSGAAARLPLIRVNSVSHALEVVKGNNFWVIGLDMEGENLCNLELPKRLALVVGSEGRGLGRTAKKACDELARIPMVGKTGSLNAAVAASIGIYEWRRSVDKL